MSLHSEYFDLLSKINTNGPIKEKNFINFKSTLEYEAYCYRNMKNFQSNFAWAVPTEKAIREISNFIGNEKTLEVGAGLGLWSRLLQLKNLDIIATDNFSSHVDKFKKRYCDVEEIDAISALNKYDRRNVLLIIWPPMTNMSSEILKQFKGNKLIYIGEDKGGCTANNEFFEILSQQWSLYKMIEIPQWTGVSDFVNFYIKI